MLKNIEGTMMPIFDCYNSIRGGLDENENNIKYRNLM